MYNDTEPDPFGQVVTAQNGITEPVLPLRFCGCSKKYVLEYKNQFNKNS